MATRSLVVAALCVTASILSTPSSAMAQQEDVTCHTCEVQMLRVKTIPSAIAGTIIRNNPSIAFSDGAFILAMTYGGSVAVFRNNSFAQIGKSGGGPGEFRWPMASAMAAGSGGSIVVAQGNVLSVVDATQARVSSRFSLHFPPASLATFGTNVLATDFGSTDVIAMDRDGRQIWNLKVPVSLKSMDRVVLASSGDTAFWTGSMYAYDAKLLRPDGTVLKIVHREPAWFKSKGMNVGEPLYARSAPQIAGMVELGGGKMLFVIHVADSQWKRGPAAGMPLDKMRPDEYLDTILDIVDINTSKLVTSVRFDQCIHLVAGSRYVWMLKENGDDEPAFDVFEPRLGR